MFSKIYGRSMLPSRYCYRYIIAIALVLLVGCEEQDYLPISYKGGFAEVYMGLDFARTIRVPFEAIEYINKRNPEYVDKLVVKLAYTAFDISQKQRISTAHFASDEDSLKVTLKPTLKGKKYNMYGKEGEDTFRGFVKEEKSFYGLQLYSWPEDENGQRYNGEMVKLRPPARQASDTFIITCPTRKDNKQYRCRYNGVYDETLTIEASIPVSYLKWWSNIDEGLRVQIDQWVN